MAMNTISGSNNSRPVDMYKVNQAKSQASRPSSQPTEPTPRANENEEVFSVQISQEALALQQQEKTRQSEVDQLIREDQEVKKQALTDFQDQEADAKEDARQQAIDVVV